MARAFSNSATHGTVEEPDCPDSRYCEHIARMFDILPDSNDRSQDVRSPMNDSVHKVKISRNSDRDFCGLFLFQYIYER